ncbi:hypothetical protein L210DRAFT_2367091 [Boletus edulis BED1]|uniref:Secreted protein n=1 Tax=Boletus edulis BED1 TaxID=1328754 RepID=A0AAD4BCV9_BOLED|nr:hypothetical protein L210DRAFT_2367091 [Boletus edulis BED1]
MWSCVRTPFFAISLACSMRSCKSGPHAFCNSSVANAPLKVPEFGSTGRSHFVCGHLCITIQVQFREVELSLCELQTKDAQTTRLLDDAAAAARFDDHKSQRPRHL